VSYSARPDRGREVYPLGAAARGVLDYSREGNVSVHIMGERYFAYYGYYSGWGWYAPGFTSDWTLIYPFYPTVGVTSFDRGTFLVTIVPTTTVNPLGRSINGEWAGTATSLLDGNVTSTMVQAAVDEMFIQSPYLTAAPPLASRAN